MATHLMRVSVRELVSLALRAGDLVRGGFVSAERLAQGTRAHQRLQRSRPAGYQAEVPVVHLLERDGVLLEIAGRVDGLLVAADRLLLEEIKTTDGDLELARRDDPVHWAQAKVYAFIVATQAQRATIDVRLTYVRLEPFATLELDERCRLEDLQPYVEGLVSAYLRWARAYCAWCDERDASIAALPFPFQRLRPGQQPLIEAVAGALDHSARLFVQAPTGIGKTVSVLYPAIRALGAGQFDKVFYLTPKTVVRTVAEKAVDDLRAAGLHLRSLTLTARGRICFLGQQRALCDPAACPYALGYYDRVDLALEEALPRAALSRRAVEEVARAHQVCPFELSLELSLWVDLVICDYNYVLDPRAFLRRFFLDGGGRYALLIDEAHDLVDRAREMFSAELRSGPAKALGRLLGGAHPQLGALLGRLDRQLRACGPAADEAAGTCRRLEGPPAALLSLLDRFVPLAEQTLGAGLSGPAWEALIDLYFEAIAFRRVAAGFGTDYACYAVRPDRQVRLRLYCLDPARNLREALRRGRAAVLFSATLVPLAYFRDLLGGDRDDDLLELDSPFAAANLGVVVAEHVATTFRARIDSYADVAAAIAAVVRAHSGNYMAFFPSYSYLQAVARHLAAAADVRLLPQTPGMSEAQREAFLDAFAAQRPGPLLGLAVMGGLFGEGIDLTGDRLIGAVIVGVGLPQLCVERDLIRDYFDSRGVPGFEYAYTYPGMNRVLQAAGRVIRSETDRGVVLLVDQRFVEPRYRQLLPRSWSPLRRVRGPEGIAAALELFWHGIVEPRYEPLDD
jgi:DNA excision repair protein ERCC-2